MANPRLLRNIHNLIVANARRAPPKPRALDIDALISITTNQVQEIEDELWLLQTEPSFFLDQARLVEKNWILSLNETTEQLSRWAAEKERVAAAANSKRWTDHEPLVWEKPEAKEGLQKEPKAQVHESPGIKDDKQAEEVDPNIEAVKKITVDDSDQSLAAYGQSESRLKEAQVPQEREKSTSRPRFPITKRSLHVVDLLFPSGRQDLGTVEWSDFVSLLAEMGFVEVRRSGSARTFKSAKASITFHKPHPSTEMGPATIWRIGRRLLKRFGWEREMFGTAS